MKSSKFRHNAIEMIGWTAVILVVGAYLANSFGILASDNLLYQIVNASGALLMVIFAYCRKVFQTMLVNIIWMVIALVSLSMIVGKM